MTFVIGTLGPRPRVRSTVHHPVTAVLAGGVLFGTAGVAQALAPVSASPIAVGAMRLGVGAVAVVAYLLLRGRRLADIVVLWRRPAVVIAAICAAAYQPFFFAGIPYAGVPVTTLVAVGSTPVAAGLLGWAMSGVRPTGTWFVATALCLLGLSLVTGLNSAPGALPGVLLGAGAGLASGTYTVMAKRLLERGVSTMEILGASFLLGSVVMVPVATVIGLGWWATPSGLALAAYLGVLTMGVANLLMVRGLGALPAATTATLTLADPLTATLLGALLLGQVLSAGALLGLVVLVGGLVLQGVSAVRVSATPSTGKPRHHAAPRS